MTSTLRICVIGSGIAGLSAAWLLSRRHDVTLFETEPRPGGHSNTVEAPGKLGLVPVDTGFIVYNVASYPNLIALFDHLAVPTVPTEMSFAVSLDDGRYEYAGASFATLFGQRSNLFSRSHWRMLADTLRFFREAPSLAEAATDEALTLGAYLAREGYSNAFIERHILPMAAAIWSSPASTVLDFPAAAFVRFFSNHGLLQINERPQWRTVIGGSREYVRRLLADFRGDVRLGESAKGVRRTSGGVLIETDQQTYAFDACIIAAHADDALEMLRDPDTEEKDLLSAFRYSRNHTVLHTDRALMPLRSGLWSSWNYLGRGTGINAKLSVSYWMNKLQPLGDDANDLFVTLNPCRDIAPANTIAKFDYMHPVFDAGAMRAQRELWRLQGRRRTWFCGSYFGYGFHEDGLQSGLAAAENLGRVRRPWTVVNESGRIHLPSPDTRRPSLTREAAA